jgi:hypothetical protein
VNANFKNPSIMLQWTPTTTLHPEYLLALQLENTPAVAGGQPPRSMHQYRIRRK